MALGELGQIALPVKDADRSGQFYGGALGLRELYRFGSLVFFDCAGVRLMLEGGDRPVEAAGSVCHYFKVDDIEASVADLKSRAVEFLDEPHCIAKMPDHELWMTFFKDPDGHMLALMEERR